MQNALSTLEKYKSAKAELQARIIENESFFNMRYQVSGNTHNTDKTAWLFNCIANKHADAMDSQPQASVLPREESDSKTAQILSDILPVILENNRFAKSYSDGWWRKLKAGTAVYSAVFNPSKKGGDIEIRLVDILNLYWEPGVCDIQDSKNVFCVKLWDNDKLLERYPDITLSKNAYEATAFVFDKSVDTSDKTVVIDWYYKKKGRLHLCKIAAEQILFSSENQKGFENGFYAHAQYPFVFDPMYPQKDSPAGFSLIDVLKSNQLYIDKLNSIILDNAALCAKKRFFIKDMSGINEEEFRDWSNELIHCTSVNLGSDSIRELEISPLPSATLSFLQQKIDELKEVSGNRDVSSGGITGGVTAASAIAALQEAGSKLSRDMISSSFLAFEKLLLMVLELVRQFYSDERVFRITAPNGEVRFEKFSGKALRGATVLGISQREPVFDIKVVAHKASPFSRISHNELAKELYALGIFLPQNIAQAKLMLSMMDFEGKEILLRKLENMQTGNAQ